MTRLRVSIAVVLSLSVVAFGQENGASSLTEADKAGGWKMLFDGASTAAWRGYKQSAFPAKGWVVQDGCLVAQGGGGDLVTVDEYGDFELEFEWRVSAKANSGVMFRVAETLEASWQTGPEYQILDDAGHNVAATDAHAAGALYDLYPCPSEKVLKPVGEFNTGRIRLRDHVLQHWLNGVKIVEVRTDSAEWREKIAASKFASYAGFGVLPKGRIALQDHGGGVAFRNIRIRDFDAPLPGEKRLFNGKDLSGWTAHLDGDAKMEDVWSVQDGVLVCKGQPVGYIRTQEKYKNYVLMLQWRFNPVTKKAGNSGVLLRVQPPDKVWPRSVEAQLQSGAAGDFWNIDEFQMKTEADRLNGRNTKKTHAAERPVGEWNEYEIIVDGSKITLKVNGEILNEAWDVLEIPGYIALQSEGAEIQFQNIRLSELK